MPKLAFFAFTLLFVSACCDEVLLPEIEDTSSVAYSPLAIGNYWIYERSTEQSDGTFQAKESLDSVFIAKDSVVKNNTYFVVEGDGFLAPVQRKQLRRDSSGYLINEHGQVFYSPNDNDGVLHTSINSLPDGAFLYAQSTAMQSEESVMVPAGSFVTRALVGLVTVNPDVVGSSCEVRNETHYSKDVGIVKDQVFFASGCQRLKIELVRYNVNK